MRITIFGGTGFLGSRITQTAIKAGHQVTALGRNVDIYDPATYTHHLSQSEAVIHCIGTFFPSSAYKKLVGEPLTPCSALELLKARLEGGNPISDGYTMVNTTSAEILARTTASIAPKGTPFVYISAAKSPLTNDEYIESKRRAEQLIAEHNSLKPVFFRPGILYDEGHQPRFPPSPRDILTGVLAGWDAVRGAAPRTSIDTLSLACLDACTDPEVEGVVTNEALREYENIAQRS